MNTQLILLLITNTKYSLNIQNLGILCTQWSIESIKENGIIDYSI